MVGVSGAGRAGHAGSVERAGHEGPSGHPEPVAAAVSREPRYPTVVELYAEARELTRRHPGQCRLAPIGASRAGRPLPMLSIGGRPAAHARPIRNVLVIAGPHANEPVGGPTVLRLARAVLADPALRDGTAWHLVPCIDPDAAVLNEPWTSGPVSLAAMHRYFYRPAFSDQAEWLPQRLPETRALTAVVDALRPVLVFSLHGVDVGGTFVQLTGEIPGLAESLGKSAAEHDMPVSVAAPDAHQWPSPGPGVYVMPPGESRLIVPAGVSGPTWTYPSWYGGITAIVESPMWGADRVGDPTPHPDGGGALRAAAAVLRTRSDRVAALAEELEAETRRALPDGPLLRAVAETVGIGRRVADELEAAAGTVMPVARIADAAITAERLPLRAAAMLGRMAPGHGRVGPAVGRLVGEWSEGYGRAARARWIPVADQVAHQARLVLDAYTLLER